MLLFFFGHVCGLVLKTLNPYVLPFPESRCRECGNWAASMGHAIQPGSTRHSRMGSIHHSSRLDGQPSFGHGHCHVAASGGAAV